MVKEIKTIPTRNSVDKYFSEIENVDRRADCETILQLMEKIIGEKPIMWGDSLVGFGKMVQKYSTGKEVEWLKMGFSSRKDSISIYFTCNLDDYTDLLTKLGKHKRGVGCLYVKKLTDVDIKVLEQLLTDSLTINESTKSKKDLSTIDEYIDTFPVTIRPTLQNLHKAIKDGAPDAIEAIKYRMPTYVLNGNLVHFAAYKNHIGFYPAPSGIEKFAKELSKYVTSKGAIQFPIDKELPYELIQRIVEFRVSANLGKAKK